MASQSWCFYCFERRVQGKWRCIWCTSRSSSIWASSLYFQSPSYCNRSQEHVEFWNGVQIQSVHYTGKWRTRRERNISCRFLLNSPLEFNGDGHLLAGLSPDWRTHPGSKTTDRQQPISSKLRERHLWTQSTALEIFHVQVFSSVFYRKSASKDAKLIKIYSISKQSINRFKKLSKRDYFNTRVFNKKIWKSQDINRTCFKRSSWQRKQ